jgi:hypothetical protein
MIDSVGKKWIQTVVACVLILLVGIGGNLGLSAAEENADAASGETRKADLLIVVGAGGLEQYQELFSEWTSMLRSVGEQAQAKVTVVGPELPEGSTGDLKDQLQSTIESLSADTSEPLWIAMIGHGTFDGRTAKFNIAGPDVSSQELAEWLKPLKRPLAVMNTASASAPFLNALSGPNRVILTATRDGFELNFARFGSYLVKALGSSTADLDKDGQTSLLEAFIMASRQVDEFYEVEGRLASEHALLDDTGDQKGIAADWFKGVRPVKQPEGQSKPDGRIASQFHLLENALEKQMSPEIKQRRDELEQAIFELRDHRNDMDEAAYFERLEALLIPFAELYAELDQTPESEDSAPPEDDLYFE